MLFPSLPAFFKYSVKLIIKNVKANGKQESDLEKLKSLNPC